MGFFDDMQEFFQGESKTPYGTGYFAQRRAELELEKCIEEVNMIEEMLKNSKKRANKAKDTCVAILEGTYSTRQAM